MPPGHPIIILKSNYFNMAAVSVKRSIVLDSSRLIGDRPKRIVLTLLSFHTWKRSLNAIPFIPDRTNSVSSVRVALNAPPRKRLQTKILLGTHFS